MKGALLGASILLGVASAAADGNYALCQVTGESSPKGGVTYYFSESQGSDGNDCISPSKPCQSVSRLNSLEYSGGDTVALLAGDVWRITSEAPGIFGPNSSLGKQNYTPNGSNLTITTYGSGKCNPIAGITSGCATFTLADNSPLTGGWIFDDASYLVFKNTLFIGRTAAAMGFQTGSGILIYNEQSNSGRSVTIDNTGIEDVANLIRVDVPSGSLGDLTIENSHLAGSSPNATIDNGVLIQGNVTSCTVQSNLITNIGGHDRRVPRYYAGGSGNGILISDGATGCIVQFNAVSHFGANVNSCGGGAGIWTYIASRITIQFNESYNGGPTRYTAGCDWNGFDIDAGSADVVVQYNYSHDNYGAGFNWYQCDERSAFKNNIYRYNVSERDSSNLAMGAVSISGCNNRSTHGAIYNNTIFTHGAITQSGSPYVAVCVNYFNDTDALFANNICVNDNGNVMVYLYAAGVAKFSGRLDGNNYYQTRGSPQFRDLTGSPRTGLGEWQAASGQDIHSVSKNPSLNSVGNGKACYYSGTPSGPSSCPSAYILQSGSPIVGAGLNLAQAPYNLSVGRRDYYGSAIPHSFGTGYNIGADGQGR
jgi:hypothetical protein